MDLDDPELDPRLAALYDIDNPWGDGFDFFATLARETPRRRIVDIGCGTGTLTVALALEGHSVTGIDPNPAFLAIAASKTGAEQVTWIRGTAADLPDGAFDLALMTSHVAQVFLGDEEWAEVLAHVKRALVPGGTLAFDTRDPATRAWETWGGTDRRQLADGTVVDNSIDITFEEDVAVADHVMAFSDGTRPGDELLSEPSPGTTWARARWGYRFRSPDLVRRTVEAAGFEIEALYGGWHQEPLGAGVGEIVVVARA